MKKILILKFVLFLSLHIYAQQKVIPIYNGKAPGSENWAWDEKEMYSYVYQTQVVYNVSQPTITVFLPPDSIATGTAVIIAPGGAFHTLSINNEGTDVAKWLNAKGIAAFVLKYRLAHSITDDPVKELIPLMSKRNQFDSANAAIIPLAINDGLEAIKYVRNHAAEFGIDPKRIGFMGFSAGGTVTAGVTFNYTAESRPDFIAPIYAHTGAFATMAVPPDAPPMFVAAATDDNFGLAPHSVKLYSDWIAAGKPAELHMYAKGGHGFGMRKQNIPADNWIVRFSEWLNQQGLMKSQVKK